MRADTEGLVPLLKELKGPLFRDVNRELRSEALQIAMDMLPAVQDAVRQSPAAPKQVAAVVDTARAYKDRVPVVAFGRVNPKLPKFSRRGPRKDGGPRADPKDRRFQVAHGVVYGPLGGRKSTAVQENYYKRSRDPSGGALGRAMAPNGSIGRVAADEYLQAFNFVLTRHGFVGPSHSWNGRG